MFFLVGILVNPPAPKRGTEKIKRVVYPNLRSARGEITVSSADLFGVEPLRKLKNTIL